MLSFRKTIQKEDVSRIRQILESTGFFNQSLDEIDVAVELAELSLKNGNNIENYEFIFAEENQKAVGFGCYARIPCTLSSFEIYWIGVDKLFQGKGIGKALIQRIVETVKGYGATKIVLQTAGREQYVPTQKFYNTVGFEMEARIKDYFAVGDDCLIYTFAIK